MDPASPIPVSEAASVDVITAVHAGQLHVGPGIQWRLPATMGVYGINFQININCQLSFHNRDFWEILLPEMWVMGHDASGLRIPEK